MEFKSLFAAGATALSLATFAPAAEAGTNIDIFLGVGGPAHYAPAPMTCAWWEDCGYDGPHFVIPEHRHEWRHREVRRRYIETRRLDCDEAIDRVRAQGFRHVRVRDCDGTTYRFRATRHGVEYVVKVNAQSGRFSAYAL